MSDGFESHTGSIELIVTSYSSTFAKDSTTCTGLFQTADGRSISVQGVVLPASDNVTIDSIAPAYEDAEVDQVDEKNSSETAEYAPPPAYHRLEVAE